MSARLHLAMSALALAACAGVVASCGRGGGTGDHSGPPLRVAAAADLALAFEELGKDFERQTGRRVDFTFGSTGLLERQIEEGAPFDVFAAANVSYADAAVKAGACDGATKRLYAQGRLALWVKDAASLPKSLAELTSPRFSKIAIANPEHAPYGKAAEESLAKAGVLGAVKNRLVFGDNVQQTLMFAQTGNVEVAIVALSLALKSGGAHLPIDPTLHVPIDQALVACTHRRPTGKPREARAFIDFLSSPPARATMRRHGFLLPGEPSP